MLITTILCFRLFVFPWLFDVKLCKQWTCRLLNTHTHQLNCCWYFECSQTQGLITKKYSSKNKYCLLFASSTKWTIEHFFDFNYERRTKIVLLWKNHVFYVLRYFTAPHFCELNLFEYDLKKKWIYASYFLLVNTTYREINFWWMTIQLEQSMKMWSNISPQHFFFLFHSPFLLFIGQLQWITIPNENSIVFTLFIYSLCVEIVFLHVIWLESIKSKWRHSYRKRI